MISTNTSTPWNADGLKLRRLHRTINREQGRALEMIGHAADYLIDCYLYEGDDNQLIDFRPTSEALHILTCLKFQIVESLPLSESFISRAWNRFRRRNGRR